MGRARLSRDERRQRILAVALDVFSRQGFYGARMEDIARTAEVNISLIYQHFPHKEALFDALFDTFYTGNPMSTRLAELLQQGSPWDVFHSFAQRYVTIEERDIKIQRLLLFVALERPDVAQRHFEKREANVIAILAQYIEKRITDGVFHSLDAQLAARLFTAQASMYMLESRVLNSARWEGYSQETVLSAMVSTFLEGLQKTPLKGTEDRG